MESLQLTRMVSPKDRIREGEDQDDFMSHIRRAESIIVIPGYGMAPAQARHEIKKLADLLQGMNKKMT